MFSAKQKNAALVIACIAILVGALVTLMIAVNSISGTPETPVLQRFHAAIMHPSAPYFFLGLFGISALLSAISGRIGAAVATVIILAPALLSFILGPINAFSAPKGAIIMVSQVYASVGSDEPRACPEGWSAFDQMASRMPLGAGVPSDADLTTRQLGIEEQGGAEFLVLSERHIPQHDHSHGNFDRLLTYTGDRTAWANENNRNLEGRQEPNLFDSRTILPFGAGQNGNGEPLNHMPPFQVVQFCMKD